MQTNTTYARRRAAGVCMQCGSPELASAVFCLTHKLKHDENQRNRRWRERPKYCATCGVPVVYRRKYCSTCQIEAKRTRKQKAKKVRAVRLKQDDPVGYWYWVKAKKLRGGTSARDLAELMNKQGQRCVYSGEVLQLASDNTHLDHILPRSRGGSDHISNLQWITKQVNRMKSDLTHEEFIEACQQVVEHQKKQNLLRIA